MKISKALGMAALLLAASSSAYAQIDREPPSSPEDKLAIETAYNRSDTLDVRGDLEYQGVYNGQAGQGCGRVSVIKIFAPNVPKFTRTDIYNYTVCGDLITEKTETMPEYVPKELDATARRVANMALRNGVAQASDSGFLIKGNSARGIDRCSVQMKLFKDGNLVSMKTINGCR